MIASIKCADGATAVIGDRVWMNKDRCEVLGIAPGIVLVRTAAQRDPVVVIPLMLRRNPPSLTQ